MNNDTEDLIKEIVAKVCPFHGKHPVVEIPEVGEMNISACCNAFLAQIGNIVNVELQNPFQVPAVEII